MSRDPTKSSRQVADEIFASAGYPARPGDTAQRPSSPTGNYGRSQIMDRALGTLDPSQDL